jgi:hypothetical protein
MLPSRMWLRTTGAELATVAVAVATTRAARRAYLIGRGSAMVGL